MESDPFIACLETRQQTPRLTYSSSCTNFLPEHFRFVYGIMPNAWEMDRETRDPINSIG